MSSPEAGKKIAKEGVLKKRGGFRTNWLERKFVLKDGAIQYFENAKAAKFKGSVPTMFISEVRKTFPDMGGKAGTPVIVWKSPAFFCRRFQFANRTCVLVYCSQHFYPPPPPLFF
jgi:hypothetical protein